MDHSYTYVVQDEAFQNEEVIENNNPDQKENDLNIDEKVGDDYLIDLYRERRFLYDKQDKNFKDNIMKENAWLEISKIMIEKNCGAYYTTEYCQKRMKTLREKFSRLQRNEEKNYKSGSAASTEKKPAVLKQLSFLNTYIQRRRTCSNIKDIKEEFTSSKENIDNLEENTDNKILFNNATMRPNEKYKILENRSTDKAKENTFLKRKSDEENILSVITNLTNHILSDSSQNSNLSDSSQNSKKTAETVFAEYIALELERLSEPERTIKKQKLMEVLSTPIEK